MKINITENHIVELILNNKISIQDIDINDRKQFIKNNARKILSEYFKNNQFKQLELLFEMKEIQDIFFAEVNTLVKSANINYVEALPENNFITDFIWSMSRQDFIEKEGFLSIFNNLILDNNEGMKDFFNIRIGESKSGFRKYQPIGLSYLRMIEKDIALLFDKNIISLDLFSPNTKDTIAHCLYQYSFENNKVIIDKIAQEKNLVTVFLDKNDMGQNPLDKLSSDLRVRNIDTLEYLFTEKLDLNMFKKEFLNYIIKCSHILKNKQTKETLRQRVFHSLELLFNMDIIQYDSNLKDEIAKVVATKCEKEVHYIWLNAKLRPLDRKEKKLKI